MPIARFSDLNWRRALAEVALIFIGISLALLFDNWNEDRKERNLEHQLLSEVRDDLVETRVDLLSDIENSEQRLAHWKNMAAAVAEGAPMGDDWAAMLADTLDYSVLFPKTSGYRSLTSQGMGILSDPDVRKKITDFYELRLGRIALFEQRAFPNFSRVYLPYLHRITRVDPDFLREAVGSEEPLPPFVEHYELLNEQALRADPQFIHLLFQMTFDTRLVLSNYRVSLDELDELILLIENQLASDD